MKHMLSAFYARPLAAYLVAALIAISTLAGPAEAMLVPAAAPAHAGQHAATADRAADMAKVQKTLETRELQQRLQDFGLSPEEISARINALSDKQLHQFAANMDSVQAGGDVLGFVLGLAIIAGLVVLIIFLLEGRVEIRRK